MDKYSIENNIIKRVEQRSVFFPTSPSELSNIFRSLRNKKSAGHDGLNGEIDKISLPVICEYLCNVFDTCFEKGYFPLPFKKAKMIPLNKEGNKNDPANYIPISLLTLFSKIFEILINKRIMSFFGKHRIFWNAIGFQPKKYCINVLIKFTVFISEALEQKLSGVSLFIALKKLLTQSTIIF